MARYDAAGGGLLAGGLAYAALFAIVPAVLLSAAVAGLLVADPDRRRHVTDLVVAVLPPLRDLVAAVLDAVSTNAAPVGLLGALALVWGASRLAAAFDDAIARVIGGPRRRGLVRRNVGAIAAVLLLVGALLAATLIAGLAAFLGAGQDAGVIGMVASIVSLALALLPLVAIVGVTVVVYRVLPIPRPPWLVVLPPGIVVGFILGVLAQLFVFLAPRLVGAAALLGALATVFMALAWLALSFQAILIGAAWVGDRMERRAPPIRSEPEA